jgi:signal transduction histidine kinase
MFLDNFLLVLASTTETHIAMAVVLEELAELLREELRASTDLRVRVSEPCIARISGALVACFVTTIISVAVDAFRGASRWDGRIELRAELRDGVVVIEVHDNGPVLPVDLDSGRRAGHARAASLAAIRERLRTSGGELLAESDATGTTVSIYLSAKGAAAVAELPAHGIPILPTVPIDSDS